MHPRPSRRDPARAPRPALRSPCRCSPPAPRTPHRLRRRPATSADPRALTRRRHRHARARCRRPTAPAGNLTLLVTNAGTQGHRVLPARRGRPADRRRGREHRPGHLTRDLVVQRPGRAATSPPASRAWSARASAPTSPSPIRRGGRGRRRRRRSWSTRRTANYAAYVKDQSDQLVDEDRRSSSTPTRPATTTRPARSTPGARSTGSGSRRWPSRSATSTRRWTSARPTSSRARSGPAGTGSRRTSGRQRAEGYTPLTDRGAGDVRRRPAGQHRDARRAGPGAHLHRRPDRQRLARPARRGRHRQGDRRGGVLVAHRPVGLPGQRRRRPGRFEGVQPLAARRRTPSSPSQLDDQVRRLQALLDAQREGDGFVTLRRADARAGQGALRRRQRAVRAAVAAHRSGAVLTTQPTPDRSQQARPAGRRASARAGVAGALAAGRAAAHARRGRTGGSRAGRPAPRPASYPFHGDAPGRHRHPGPGPAALRRVRRHDRRPRRADRAAAGLDRCRRADDPGLGAGRVRRRPRAPYDAAARRHRRGDRPAGRAG